MNKKLILIFFVLAVAVVAPGLVLAAQDGNPNGNSCDTNGAENRPEGKGPDCPEPESQNSEQTSQQQTASSSSSQSTASGGSSTQTQGGSPADGTRGNADNKDPGGQDPPPHNSQTLAAAHAQDHNKGYECDDNPGIGDGNPAHSADCVRVEAAQAAPPAPPAAPAAPAAARLPRTGSGTLPVAILAVQLILIGFVVTMVTDRLSSLATLMEDSTPISSI